MRCRGWGARFGWILLIGLGAGAAHAQPSVAPDAEFAAEVDAAIRGLQSSVASVRHASAEVLARVGPPAGRATSALVAAIESETDAHTTCEMLRAVGNIGSEAASSQETVWAIVESAARHNHVRAWALYAYVRVATGDLPVERIRGLLRSNSELQEEAIAAAGRLGTRGDGAVPELRKIVRSVDEVRTLRLRRCAARALGQIGTPAAISVLVEALEQESEEVLRHDCALALYRSNCVLPATARAPLLECAVAGGKSLRQTAARALGHLPRGDREAILALERIVADDPSDNVRRYAQASLEQLRSKPDEETPEPEPAPTRPEGDGSDPRRASGG